MRDGIDRRDLDAALPSRPVLNPCVILGFGPTAAEALTAAQARIHTHLKGIPPFHAFLTMEQKDGQVSCSLQLGGAQVAPVWKHAPSPAPLADAARWLEYALGRVTESWRNLEHSVYHGSRNDFERVELIVV